MEQIEQLKTMRDEALARLQLNPDYKLVTSLDALISDLEASFAPAKAEAVEAAIADMDASSSDAQKKSDGKDAQRPVKATITATVENADNLIDDIDIEKEVEKSLDKDLAALGKEPDTSKPKAGSMAN